MTALSGRPQLVRHAREELRLVAAGLREGDALLLELLVETGVGQGDGRLAREGGEQLARLVAERPGRLATHDERPDDPVGTHERDRDERAPARPVQHGQVGVERAGLGVEIGDLEHLAGAGRPAHPRPVDVDLRATQRVDDVLARAVGRAHPEESGRLVELHERPAVGVRELHGVGDDRRQDLVRDERRADRLADLGERLELVDLAGQLGRAGSRARRRARRAAARGPPAPRRSTGAPRRPRRRARPRCARR